MKLNGFPDSKCDLKKRKKKKEKLSNEPINLARPFSKIGNYLETKEVAILDQSTRM